VDIERLGADSRNAREHPEWLLPLLDTTTTAINTAIPEARQYMTDQLAAVIARYELDWFKLDRNVHVWENGYNARDGYLENVTWRHYEFVYDLYRRLRERFPGLMMENCAGGGGRPDLGMMASFDTCLITDWPRPPRSTRIFNGMSLCLPPERLFMLGGVAQDGHERADLDYQLRQFLFGQFYLSGLWPPDSPPNPAQVARIKHAVDLYKSWVRPWLPECRMYHHTPELPGLEPSGWCVWESVSADRTRALVGLFRLAGPAEEEYPLRLRGLDPGREYRVTFDNSGGTAALSGAALLNEGLRVRLARPMTSELLVVEA
jgi:alpha-galactosidase